MSPKLLSLLFLLVPAVLQAQTKISGKITDGKKQPLPGVNIYIKGTYDGASSAADGSYSFTTSAKGDQLLSATIVGYKPFEQTVNLGGTAINLNIMLKDAVNELKMVTISAGSFEASDDKKNTILQSLDIVTTGGANADIVAALKTLPGAQQVGDKEGLFVRGGTSYETQTFIDGMMVRNPFFSGMPDFAARGRFSPFLFKGTSFSSGGYSAQYGQGLSSALILESNDLPTRSSSSVGIMTIGGSLGFEQLAKDQKSAYTVEANYTNLLPYFKVFKTLRQPTTYPEIAGGSFSYRRKTSKTGMLKAYFYGNWSRFGYRSESLEYEGDEELFELKNYNVYSNITYRESLGKGWRMNAGISYSTNKDNLHMDTVMKNLEARVGSRSDLSQARLVFSKSLGAFSSLRVGGEYQYAVENTSYNQYQLDYDDNFGAGFIEADVYFTPKFVGRAGLRTEYTSLMDKVNLAPRVSMSYKLDDAGQVSLAYGEFYQKPEQQYLRQRNDLNYMRATHYIATYERRSVAYTLRTELFYKKYHDLIKTAPALNNDGTGYAQGVELFWRDKKTIKNGDYWISYSYLDTKRDYLNYPREVQPDFAAKHTASFVYKQFFSAISTNIGVTYSFATGRPYYNPNRPVAEFMRDRTRTFNTLGLTANYLTTVGKAFTVFVLSISNLAGQQQEYGYRYSSDGLRRSAVRPMTPSFFFVGMFMSFGVDRRQEVIDNN
ncbi:TonB-dependent receptor [Chitinophaga horti]|uniref:TonB-dependent receptor n=1 Tax=Chitinophaga horti TaxID=2920382 RepID=A0ABY6J169_9BACT|nr:TonB-dependent receptor [Chitinophaga horti]UYQ93265.1 TonB-dependent receptor [Chitinophaga horti]